MRSASHPVIDSAWFWSYLLTTAALISMALVGPKFVARQAEVEREFQGRQRVAQNVQGQEPSGTLSTAEKTLISLRPLFFGLAAITTVAWIAFYRTRMATQVPLTHDP